MKAIVIALKDLQHVFQNIFSLAMMLGAPLFITGLLYFAFGGLSSDGGYALPVTKVQIVNLDQAKTFAAGDMLVDFLQDGELSQIIQATTAQDEASARQAVDDRQAGVAVIISADFSAAVVSPDRSSSVQLYSDPTLTIGPGIVKDLISHFLDGFSGAKIAAQVAAESLATAGLAVDPLLQAQAAQEFAAWLQSSEHDGNGSSPRLMIHAPAGEQPAPTQGAALIGPVMAGMLVFFLFYMGANSAERIILEDEQGTLARLFATPTRLSTILFGKFLGIVAILVVQLILLLLASRFLFGIRWGNPGAVFLVSLSLIIVSAGFGVMIMSFVKDRPDRTGSRWSNDADGDVGRSFYHRIS